MLLRYNKYGIEPCYMILHTLRQLRHQYDVRVMRSVRKVEEF